MKVYALYLKKLTIEEMEAEKANEQSVYVSGARYARKTPQCIIFDSIVELKSHVDRQFNLKFDELKTSMNELEMKKEQFNRLINERYTNTR